MNVQQGSGYCQIKTATVTMTHAFSLSSVTTLGLGLPSIAPFEVAAGGAIVVNAETTSNTTEATNGLQAYLDLLYDNGSSVIRTVQIGTNVSMVANTQFNYPTTTFYATSDGTATGAPRCGTFRLRIRVTYVDAVSGNYNADSDGNFTSSGTPNVWATATHTATAGAVRAGVDITSIVFSKTLGGASASLFVYNDRVFDRTTLAHQPITPQILFTDIYQSGGVYDSGSTSSTTAADPSTVDGTHASPTIYNRWTAAASSLSHLIASYGTSVQSALTGWAWTHFTSAPAGWTLGGVNNDSAGGTGALQVTNTAAIPYDNRITFTQLLQVNSSTWATPPSSTNVASGQLLATDLAFLSSRATDANGNGIATLGWNELLWDNGNLIGSSSSPVHTQAMTATTQGGQTGWGSTGLAAANGFDTQFSDTKPSGGWTQKEVITSPANATGLETSNTRTLTLLAPNPNIVVICGGGDPGRTGIHSMPGRPILVGLAARNRSIMRYQPLDSSPAPTVTLIRFNSNNGHGECLGSDGATWFPFVSGGVEANPYRWTLTAGTQDPNIYTVSFTAAQTAQWGTLDVYILGLVYVNSTPYSGVGFLDMVGTSNAHDSPLSWLGIPN